MSDVVDVGEDVLGNVVELEWENAETDHDGSPCCNESENHKGIGSVELGVRSSEDMHCWNRAPEYKQGWYGSHEQAAAAPHLIIINSSEIYFLPIHGTEVVVMQPVWNAVFVEDVFAFLYPHYFSWLFIFVDSLVGT